MDNDFIVLTSSDGTKYEVDVRRARSLDLLRKQVNDPWYPHCKEPYFYLNENLMPKEILDTMRGNNLSRRFRSNMFKTADDALVAAEFLRGSINDFILKFAIENDCLVRFDDNSNKKRYAVVFLKTENKYCFQSLKDDINITSPMLNDIDKVGRLVEILNERSMGFVSLNNFIEEEKVVYVK